MNPAHNLHPIFHNILHFMTHVTESLPEPPIAGAPDLACNTGGTKAGKLSPSPDQIDLGTLCNELQLALITEQQAHDNTRREISIQRDAAINLAASVENENDTLRKIIKELQEAHDNTRRNLAATERLLRVAIDSRETIEQDRNEAESALANLRARIRAVL